MRIRYLIRLKEPIQLEDHWLMPFLGGELRLVADGKKITAFEAIFRNRPPALSPSSAKGTDGTPPVITIRDTLLPFVTAQLEKSFAYLQCYFDVEILIREVDAEYIAEHEEEKNLIAISAFSTRHTKTPPLIPFDLVTRAIMAAESGGAPQFEATLASAARTSMLQGRYIDGFRYAFLLMESLYGGGKFKSEQLKQALSENSEFRAIVKKALSNPIKPSASHQSDTELLLASEPDPKVVE